MTARRGLTQWKNILLVVAAALIINLPPVHSAIQSHRLSAGGVDLRARVIQHRTLGGDYFLSFSVPRDTPRAGDPAFKGTARVDPRTYRAATSSGVLSVRVLPGSTTVWRVTGQLTSRLGLYLALAADLLLVLIVLVYVRFRSRLRPVLVLVAEEDLVPVAGDEEEGVMDRIGGQRYHVCGAIDTIEDDAVVLVVGDRRVRVLLDGNHNPAGPRQLVSAIGTMVA